jgi:hypothetical protein
MLGTEVSELDPLVLGPRTAEAALGRVGRDHLSHIKIL